MLKTFLVEDEVVIREMIKKMIPWEQYGFELAGEASDGDVKAACVQTGEQAVPVAFHILRLHAQLLGDGAGASGIHTGGTLNRAGKD